MNILKGLVGSIFIVSLVGCMKAVPVYEPCPATPVGHVEPMLPWPDEPVYRLKDITKDMKPEQKLPAVLEANRLTINNLEETLKKTGRVQPPK